MECENERRVREEEIVLRRPGYTQKGEKASRLCCDIDGTSELKYMRVLDHEPREQETPCMHKKTTRDLRPSGYHETRDTGNVIRETIFDAGARRTNEKEKEKENTKDEHETTRGIWPPSYHEAGANLNDIKD